MSALSWTSFEIAINLFEAWLIIYFMKGMMRPKFSGTKGYLIDGCTVGIIALWYTLYLYIDVPVLDTAIFFVPFFYGLFATEGKWYHGLFWTVVIALVFSGVASVTMWLCVRCFDVGLERLMEPSPLRFAFVICTNLGMLLVVVALLRIMDKAFRITWYSVATLISLNGVCLIAVELLFAIGVRMNIGDQLIYPCLCLFVISFLSIMLYELLIRSERSQREYQTTIQHMEESKKYSEELGQMYADMQALRHDIKHHITALGQIQSEKDIMFIGQYVEELNAKVQCIPAYATGNLCLDALLTVKSTTMARYHIGFQFSPYPVDQLPIAGSDFCSIVGNLLDNAIEAVLRLKGGAEHIVTLKFARSWDMFYIICENPYDPKTIQLRNGIFQSSKGAAHGIGTRSIQRIVNKAQGRVSFRPKADLFRVQVVLPYRTQRKQL